MTLQDLGNIGEFVAAIATLVTLVYLALQIRQNTRALQGTSHDSSVNRMQAWHLALATDPDLGSIQIRASRGEELTDEERDRVRYLWNYALIGSEALYYQHSRGNVGPEVWEAQLARIAALAKVPEFRNYWQNQRGFTLTDAFERVIERELEE